MSARAPIAIEQLWADIHKAVPRAVLSGIVGDTAHSFGYHLARRDLPADDYSVTLVPDRLGASDCASALDVSLPPDLMITCTQRLHAAAQAHDPRLKALREFCGTVDGTRTFPWDVYHGDVSEGIGSWDNSHLWHIHLSFLRQYADLYAQLAPIADVFAGVPLKYPPESPRWSDTVTKDEVTALIRAEVLDAARSTLLGGDHGAYTHKANPWLVQDAGHGVLDRLAVLEKPAAK